MMMIFIAFSTASSAPAVGGRRDVPGFEKNSEIQSLARFAVDEFNKQHNAALSLSKVVRAQEQVVAGTMYYLTIEVVNGHQSKLYEAKIWVKPWQNFKQLQDFKPVQKHPAFTHATKGN